MTGKLRLVDREATRTYSTLAKAKGEWQKRVNDDMALTLPTIRLAHHLALCHVNGQHYLKTGEMKAYPTVEDLAAELHIEWSTVWKATTLLKSRGHVHVKPERAGRFTHNLYFLVCDEPKSTGFTTASRQSSSPLPAGSGESHECHNSPLPKRNFTTASGNYSPLPAGSTTYLKDLSEGLI